MKIYLDDDMASPALGQLLRRAQHEVQLPADAGHPGAKDAIHLAYAIQHDQACLTGNHDDFAALHTLVLAAGGHHSGILVVRKDNNPTRDMTARGIVRAIQKLLNAGIGLQDQFVVLNHWR